MWVLTGSDGAEAAPLTFRVRPGAIKTIGRAARADFVVDAGLVSRLHCRLEAADDHVLVIDLDSTNGTYINDARVSRGRLMAGDRLKVGRVTFAIARSEEVRK
jgi:pSer/pThr/pTyr-binding forkhead associated (FHA) protein